ncbi:MAG: hypothetical protein M9930_10630 [Anaerolineae bacterium]|nr:hypothetical protein [Anaerolineae bacterium]
MSAPTRELRQATLARQIERVATQLEKLEHTSRIFHRVRLSVFFVGVALAVIAFFQVGIVAFWLLILATVVAFSTIVYFHRTLLRQIDRYRGWQRIKSTHLARMTLDWDGISAEMPIRDPLPLETDLDLVGVHSLHRLLDTTVTTSGSERLRAWLTAPRPDPDRIAARQALVMELVPRPLFRDKLLLQARLAARSDEKWSADTLQKWLENNPATGSLRPWLLLLSALSIANIILFSLYLAGIAASWWLITFLPYVALSLLRSRDVQPVFAQAAQMQDALGQLGAVFGRLERDSYHKMPNLRRLCTPFLDADHRPSRYLQRIGRIVNAMGIRGNGLVALLLNAVVPWDIYFTHRLAVEKSAIRQFLPVWMDTWFEVESLCALATFAYLNPDYAFPTISADGPVLSATRLGHPLIPHAQKIANDVTVDKVGEILLITGSNMAGKSTFLRTVGLNVALAYAGSVVDAAALDLRPYRLFTCIRVSDSVIDGISYFYAEVKRLRALLDSLREENDLPLLYFIDEIFRGTNNRERLSGSRAYVRALAGGHGVGLISTHDLELVHLADEMPELRNYHFREAVIDGRMVFDYTLRPGPCPTTNALQIMRLEGLPVPTEWRDETEKLEST